MINDYIKNIFDFIPETNITEEYFYEHKGEYPVYSGQTENDGIVDYIDSFNQTEPCITFTTYGSAGKLYYRKGKYTIGRNCMGLRPKKDFKENINLEWFVFKFQNLFNKLRIGDKDGQKSLNKKILEEVKISIPDINVQEEELKLYKKAKSVLASLEQLKKETEDLLENEMI